MVAEKRTGTGLRMRSVCLMNSCGLARMAIMRVGCMAIMRVGCIAITLVALNMVSVVLCAGWVVGKSLVPVRQTVVMVNGQDGVACLSRKLPRR